MRFSFLASYPFLMTRDLAESSKDPILCFDAQDPETIVFDGSDRIQLSSTTVALGACRTAVPKMADYLLSPTVLMRAKPGRPTSTSKFVPCPRSLYIPYSGGLAPQVF